MGERAEEREAEPPGGIEPIAPAAGLVIGLRKGRDRLRKGRDRLRKGRDRLRWGQALLQTGKPAEARAQFEAAKGMDLSPADRAALDGLMAQARPPS